jgi:cell division protein FtsN
MTRWLTSIVLTCVILAAAGFAIAGCGSQKRTIPTKQGQSFLRQLDNISSQVDNGACTGAQDKVNALENQVSGLPSSVDPEVKRNLVAGVQRLAVLVRSDCKRATPTNTTPTTVPTVPTTPSTTIPTTPTTPSNTVPTTPTTTPTTPSTTPTTPSTTPGGGGGVTVPGAGTVGGTPGALRRKLRAATGSTAASAPAGCRRCSSRTTPCSSGRWP